MISAGAISISRKFSMAAIAAAIFAVGAAGADAQSDRVKGNIMHAGATVAMMPAVDPAIVQSYIRNLRQRAALIDQMAHKFNAEAAAQGGASFNALDWKLEFGSRLLHQSNGDLAQALSATNLSTAQALLANSATRSATQKHASESNLSVNLITPCRIVDTRFGGGGQLGPAYRLWYASNTPAIIAGQGGNAAGCGTFPFADGWVVYVTAVPPSGNTSPNFLTLQHDASPPIPTSATMNFVNQNIANFAIVLSFNGGFNAYSSGSTHVVIDLIGYVQGEAAAALDCTYNQASGTFTVGAGANGSGFSAACAAGYKLVSGACFSPTGVVRLSATTFAYSLDGTWYCEINNPTGGTVTVNVDTVCCRVPARP